MVLLAGIGTGCGALIGLTDVPEPGVSGPDSSAEGAADTSVPPTDAQPDTSPGADADAGSKPDSADARVDTGPPPTPAKAGFDLTAGGAASRSTNYFLVGAVGESPGWNGVSLSTSYTLHGGVVGSTQ
jgi:hypothetical protein